jgi:ABC-type antimicrobial peptide transport system permease subunit
MYLVVRTKTDPLTLAPAVRSIVRRLNPAQPVSEPRSLEDVVSSSVADRRMHAMVTLSFALTALAITVAGVTAVLGQMIAARRHELAIRCALGARRSDTVRLVMAYGLELSALGVGAGLALAGVAARGLVAYLFGISEYDPITFVGAALVTSLTAVIACAVPAIRASVIQPGRNLRAD